MEYKLVIRDDFKFDDMSNARDLNKKIEVIKKQIYKKIELEVFHHRYTPIQKSMTFKNGI